jgi:hypothetical protein
MKSRLITTSLIDKIEWFKKCPPTWKERAYQDLQNQLKRDYPPSNDIQQRGFDLENAVQVVALANNVDGVKASDYFKQLAGECLGAEFQKKVKRYVKIDDVEYCLYGRIDAWFPDIIKDIKSTGNYKGESYYLSTFQHRLYCFITRIPKFRYLVAEFVEEQKQIADLHIVDWTMKDPKQVEDEIKDKINQVMMFLQQQQDLWKAYNETFCLY